MTPCFDDACTEQWTESRVNIGVLLNRNLGLNVGKHFDAGDFIGKVTNVYVENDGEIFYCIEFQDGDSEDFNEREFQEGIAFYHFLSKQKVRIADLLNRSLGLKVAKNFETGLFTGKVTNVYASNAQNSEEIFYHIEYDDGDHEDFDEKEFQEGAALYCRMQKKRKRNSTHLNQSVGLKVAKQFETGIFFGQVKEIYSCGNENDGEVYYHIKYDDGDSEDFDEKELQDGVAFYCRLQKQRKRTGKQIIKETELRCSENRDYLEENDDASHSFGAVYDKATPIHTLILGTHPAKKSLIENRYFAHPSNAFWWIAGDCLGFRRDRGERICGGLMKLCADLRYDESYIIPYEKQINTLCRHGFALWDIIASCQRKGSLDRAIKNEKPNDIEEFVEQNPTIQTIVFANGKSGLTFFTRHFSSWLKSGKLILHKAGVTSSRSKASISSLNKDKPTIAEKNNAITCICALSVSAAATITYKEKRDFWDEFVYSPGLKLQQQLATAKKPS